MLNISHTKQVSWAILRIAHTLNLMQGDFLKLSVLGKAITSAKTVIKDVKSTLVELAHFFPESEKGSPWKSPMKAPRLAFIRKLSKSFKFCRNVGVCVCEQGLS